MEKTVENVKTFGRFSTVSTGFRGELTPISTLSGENSCGKVDDLVENPQNGEFSTIFIHIVEKAGNYTGFWCHFPLLTRKKRGDFPLVKWDKGSLLRELSNVSI